MTVIALTSSMGTGVKYVAEQVAQKLGLKLVYREICDPARSPAPADTRTEPKPPSTRWETGLTSLHLHRQSAALADLEDLYRLAQRDNVVVCGNTPLHFLSDLAHVVKVRIRTTMALRVRRIMACMNTDESELALAKILQSDQRQAETLNRLFRIKNSESPELYDLVVDTGREPAENCVLQIVALALIKTLEPTRPSAAKLELMAEQALALRMSRVPEDTKDLVGVTTARRHGCEVSDLTPSSQPYAHVTQLFV